MKRLSLIALLITIISMNISALKLETTKEFALQGGYGEVLSISVSTMTSQAESDLIGMPFDILDPYVQYNSSVDNPSYGERVIGTWAILANCNFSLSINATPLRHVTNSNAQPLYYRLAHEFSLAYTNTSGAATEVKGYYVFVPNENATDGSGTTRAYIGNSYKTDNNGNGKIEFAELVNNYWALQGTYIGAVENNIYFGFTENTSTFLKNNSSDNTKLPDGIYESTVTITIEAV